MTPQPPGHPLNTTRSATATSPRFGSGSSPSCTRRAPAHPAFQRYYAHVDALQAHYGQRMHLGVDLGVLAHAAGFAVERAGVRLLELPAAKMARLLR